MKTKLCFKCNTEKNVTEFSKNRAKKDGFQTRCKGCFRRYRGDNKESLARKRKRYCEKNAEYIQAYQKQHYDKEATQRYNKQYYQSNRGALQEYAERYRNNEENKEFILVYRKQYQKNNSAKGIENSRQYYQKNRERLLANAKRYAALPAVRAAINKWQKTRRTTDPMFRLNCNIGSKISGSLRGGKAGQHWENLVGYTLKQLKIHLERLFDSDMSWENYGKWHIDHKIPKAVFNFTKPGHEDFKRCWAIENLQPMWAHDNHTKSKKLECHFQPSLLM